MHYITFVFLFVTWSRRAYLFCNKSQIVLKTLLHNQELQIFCHIQHQCCYLSVRILKTKVACSIDQCLVWSIRIELAEHIVLSWLS